LKTLLYSDIFDYPLTLHEIEKWFNNIFPPASLRIHLQNLKSKRAILDEKGFYCVKGRKNIVCDRIKRKRYSKHKIIIARKISSVLKLIPTIMLIGISGTLAMENAKKDDDIDVIIITKKGTIWTTRFLVTCVVELLGLRRRPHDKNSNNKICLNMYLDENHMKMKKSEQDPFIAHEILQMKPLWGKRKIYQKFILVNNWTKKYLPNAFVQTIQPSNHLTTKAKQNSFVYGYMAKLLNGFEFLLKHFQLKYMQKRRSNEKISDGIIRFHPNNVKNTVLLKYQNRLRSYGLES
jgi:hypothetical protein